MAHTRRLGTRNPDDASGFPALWHATSGDFGLRPYPASILRVAALTLALAGGVFFVNLWLGSNFLYLMDKPGGSSLLDWFGPWPWHWLGLIGVGPLSFLPLYAPFWVADRVKGHRADRDRSGPRPSCQDR